MQIVCLPHPTFALVDINHLAIGHIEQSDHVNHPAIGHTQQSDAPGLAVLSFNIVLFQSCQPSYPSLASMQAPITKIKEAVDAYKQGLRSDPKNHASICRIAQSFAVPFQTLVDHIARHTK